MKIFLLVAAMVGATLAEDIVKFYTTADDNLDMDAVVNDPQQLQAFVDCFLDRKPCESVPASYKMIIPESIEQGCRRCNPAQKHLANTFLTGLKKNLPNEYVNFVNKFDPKGIYMDEFLESVRDF